MQKTAWKLVALNHLSKATFVGFTQNHYLTEITFFLAVWVVQNNFLPLNTTHNTYNKMNLDNTIIHRANTVLHFTKGGFMSRIKHYIFWQHTVTNVFIIIKQNN